MLDQLFLLVVYGGIVQAVFLVLLLNHKSVRRGRANIFLSILLIALAFSTAHILFAGSVLNHLSATVFSIGDPTFLLIAPLLWFYTLELTGDRIPRAAILHFIPFLVVITCSLLFPHGTFAFVSFIHHHSRSISILFWIVVVIQFSAYLARVHQHWNTYQRLIQQEVSSTENVSIEWVRFFMIVFMLINLVFLISLFAAIHLHNESWMLKVTAIGFALSIFALGYKGILQKDVFQPGAMIGSRNDDTEPELKEKPDPARLEQLRAYMETHQPYLNPDLTLTDLAKAWNISRGQLSALINDGAGENFYDFINKYRVEQVKNLMADPAYHHYSMLGLALEAGFKSKSTFNLIFKRFTGLTPSEYRKHLR